MVLVAFVVFFLALLANFYVPGKGFSALIIFGGNNAERTIPELNYVSHFTDEQSYGYDAQYYAQLAIRPNPSDPELATSIDNLSYRARRILLCWTAYAIGFGQPAWVLQVYALENVACWLILGWLLLRWFPPTLWENVIRWFLVMFSYGLMVSVRGSLVDGPSLLLIAIAVALIERGRTRLAVATPALSGLVKETNILGAASLAWPWPKTFSQWLALAARGLLVALPLVLWFLILRGLVPPGEHSIGSDNFAAPFAAFWKKIQFHAQELGESGWANQRSRTAVYGIVSLFVQFAVIVSRPKLQSAWWRVGAAFAGLMIFLGWAVWEGYPGAAVRVLLPMTLAFNVLLPRGWKWAVLLALGNISILSAWPLSYPPPGLGFHLNASEALLQPHPGAPNLTVKYGVGWYASEGNHTDYWRWSQKDSELRIYNPTTGPLLLAVQFKINTLSDRKIEMGNDERVLWSSIVDTKRQLVGVQNIVLVPGENRLWWKAYATPEQLHDPGDNRVLGFRLYNLELTVTEK